MRIVFVGGGSGGHFYPLIAIADAVIARARTEGRPVELFYAGPDEYDADELHLRNISFVSCPSGKLSRVGGLGNLATPFTMFWGVLVAIARLFQIYPDVVMSKGGHTSVPVVLAAAILRIPIIIHESDAKPGRANLLAARFARFIAISYPDATDGFKKHKDRVALTGIPLRACAPVGNEAPPTRPVLAIFGGSQGAERINTLILSALPELLVTYDVVHQTGRAHEKAIEELAKDLVKDDEKLRHYVAQGFFLHDDVCKIMRDASVVVSRAGSTTIAEAAKAGKPSILIPIPEEISHDQRTNAYAYARMGGATVLEERNLTPHLLLSEIDLLTNNTETRAKMIEGTKHFVFPDAADTLARALLEIGTEHGS